MPHERAADCHPALIGYRQMQRARHSSWVMRTPRVFGKELDRLLSRSRLPGGNDERSRHENLVGRARPQASAAPEFRLMTMESGQRVSLRGRLVDCLLQTVVFGSENAGAVIAGAAPATPAQKRGCV